MTGTPEPGAGAGGGDRVREDWYWVGAEPADRSDDARFRRQVAAIAREVMLAHGAEEDSVPPLSKASTLETGSTYEDGSTSEAGSTFRPTDYFDIGGTAPYLMHLAAEAARVRLTQAGTPTGSLTGDLVLLATARSPRGVAFASLSASLGLPASTLTTAVDRLVDRGLAERRRTAVDRRRRVLVVTGSGRAAAARVAAGWRVADERLLEAMTLAERDELCRLLRRAASALVARQAHRRVVPRTHDPIFEAL